MLPPRINAMTAMSTVDIKPPYLSGCRLALFLPLSAGSFRSVPAAFCPPSVEASAKVLVVPSANSKAMRLPHLMFMASAVEPVRVKPASRMVVLSEPL